jgi:hypothetical protein
MILDQTIGSARAEKHKNLVAHRIVRNLLTAILASALTLPSLAAWGMDSSPKAAAKNRRHAAVATNPVSRFDALDELEHFDANAED